uniref:Kinesin motor domain-containing protein n=1 Tax=Leptobrachium leishanense TaxID=445787 RepID=A0A8C5MW87_9ANUR
MTAATTSDEGNVSVVVRVRPPNPREQEGNQYSTVQVVDDRFLIFDPDEPDTSSVFSNLKGYDGTRRKGKDLKFIFDRVFGENATQQDVFEHTTKEILDGVLNGYNCSVFAYGATGAGKTHTMLGTANSPGVMYLTMVELYRRIEAIQEEKQCEVLISYLEVYNEQIQDLLSPKGNLAIREDPQKGVVVQGLSFHQPKSADQLLQMLANGNLNRTQHPTDANASSSRSHAVFQSRKAHIPYRDSKLTRLLKDSIGGNCRTVMIAAISPSSLSYDDTYNTLKYANRAKEIKLSLKSNVISLDCHISKYATVCEELKAEVAELKEKLRFYEMKEAHPGQPDGLPAGHRDRAERKSIRLEGSMCTSSPNQARVPGTASPTRRAALGLSKKRLKLWQKREMQDSGTFSQSDEEEKTSICISPAPIKPDTERLVDALLRVVRKQFAILKAADLLTPGMETEVQELELMTMGQSADTVETTAKEQTEEDCETQACGDLQDKNLQLPQPGDVDGDVVQEEVLVIPPATRKKNPVKRSRQELLPDTSPSLRSPVIPVKRRRQTEPSNQSNARVPSTPEVQVKRQRKSSIPSRSQINLRSSTQPLSYKANEATRSRPSKQASLCTPKYTTQANPGASTHVVTKGRVPLGTSAFQNCAAIPPAALAASDLNTTFDLTEGLDKTVTFGTTEFTGWENFDSQRLACTFGKSSGVAVFTMNGLSVKHSGSAQLASAAKSYAHRRKRSSSSTSSRLGSSTANRVRTTRLTHGTGKNPLRPPTIAESCSPRVQSGKKTGKGPMAFGRTTSAAPMTRFMHLTAVKS